MKRFDWTGRMWDERWGMESEEEKPANGPARLKEGRCVQWQGGVKGRRDNVTATPRATSQECWGRGCAPVSGEKKKGVGQTVRDGGDASPVHTC